MSNRSATLQKVFPFLEWLPMTKKTWKDDLIAGITGTIIVIPQAVAFAMIAGMPPVYGFYVAMLTPIIAALWGSSYHLISGPTTTSSIVVYGTITKFVHPETDLETYISLALVLTTMTGFIKLFMGLLKMGKLVNFVSNTVVIGFTAGAGILIAFKQLKHVFGLKMPQGSEIVEILMYIPEHWSEINWYVFVTAVSTLLIAILIKKYIKVLKRFNMLIAMLAGSILALILGGDSVGIETVGQIPSHLPPFSVPQFSWERIQLLMPGAFILALLGLVEAVSIARAIALYSNQRLNVNQEFIGQGLSNIIPSFFNCYASSGSFTRSGVNFQAGAKTPLSAIFASFFLMLVLLFLANYAAYLPKAAMGGIILLVGYNLVDIIHIKHIFKTSKKELIVLMITIIGTLFFALEMALLAGILASLYFYLERTSKPNIAVMGLNEDNKYINLIREENLKEDLNCKIIRIDGSLYFGSIETVAEYFHKAYKENEVKSILVMSAGINFIDFGAAEWLATEVQKWKNTRGGIYFQGMKVVSQDVLRKGGFFNQIGSDVFFADMETAVDEIKKRCE